MRLQKIKRPKGCEIEIAPLIDVVFLLIIFFMTVSQLTRIEVEELALPEATQGEDAPEEPAGPLALNVRADGSVVYAGQSMDGNRLEVLLAGEVERLGADGVSVVVRGDRIAEWSHVATVLQACAKQGIRRVRVAVIEPKEAV